MTADDRRRELGLPERLFLATMSVLRWFGRHVRGRYVGLVGGPARARVIFLFGGVLALNSAQVATIGAVAPQLERALHIGNTKIGLLSSAALIVGALAVIPIGLVVDRAPRIPLLAGSIIAWSVATLLGAVASSYSSLLLTRLGLGLVAATAGPAIASLTGDYFPSEERGRIYAYILGGEIAGTAVGFIVSGTLASLISWRVSLFVLALPGFFLARSLWRTVPEPKRGGQSRLAPGAVDIAGPADEASQAETGDAAAPAAEGDLAREAALRRGVRPNPHLILLEDASAMPLVRAVRYVLRVPTNLLFIAGSALGYFFLSGLQTFAVVFVRGHYHASQATATLVLGLLVVGSLIGTLVSGRLSDALVRRGTLEARVWIPAVCYFGAAALLIPGFLGHSLAPAIWFDVGGAGLIAAANPPLDAARLDIMPAGLWGRAESTRTFLRSLAQAIAPLLFGAVADLIAGIEPEQAPIGTHLHKSVTASASAGLETTFLVMLVSLVAAGVFILRARRTYATDVATADASDRAGPAARSAVPARVEKVTEGG